MVEPLWLYRGILLQEVPLYEVGADAERALPVPALSRLDESSLEL
jgi:hypothetical protein